MDQGSTGQTSRGPKERLVLLVDPSDSAKDPHVELLASFDGVAGLEVHQLTGVEEGEGGLASMTLTSTAGSRRRSVPPYGQFRTIATAFARRHRLVDWKEDDLARTMGLAYLCEEQQADGLVSRAGHLFVANPELVSRQRLLTVEEAMAVVGARLRTRPFVPIGGASVMSLPRAVVYRETAVALIPSVRAWMRTHRRPTVEGSLGRTLAGTVIWRASQALRARDELHEGLRQLDPEPGIEEALYHFDVLLTSTVAAFDGLARALRESYQLELPDVRCGLQHKAFRKALKEKAPEVAGQLRGGENVGTRIQVICRLRNQIHGLAPSEILYMRTHDRMIEHRVVISSELAREVHEAFQGQGREMRPFGFFLDESPPVVNIGRVTETVTSWMFEILGAMMLGTTQAAELARPERSSGGRLLPLEVRKTLPILTQVGSYPAGKRAGIPPTPATRQRMNRIVARGQRELRSPNDPSRRGDP